MKDPLWKTVLNWGTVIVFLTLPIFIMSMQLYVNTHPGTWTWVEQGLTPEQHNARFQYLYDFIRNVTVLVFGLAGLRTWENIKQNGVNNGKTKETTGDNHHARATPRSLQDGGGTERDG